MKLLLNNKNNSYYFKIQFSDKSIWGEFKEDLKVILREKGIKYQYSVKTPEFHIIYQNNDIQLKIQWNSDDTIFCTLNVIGDAQKALFPSREIFELLQLFSGQLIDGDSPYNWII